jgi:hypothetical protein
MTQACPWARFVNYPAGVVAGKGQNAPVDSPESQRGICHFIESVQRVGWTPHFNTKMLLSFQRVRGI